MYVNPLRMQAIKIVLFNGLEDDQDNEMMVKVQAAKEDLSKIGRS